MKKEPIKISLKTAIVLIILFFLTLIIFVILNNIENEVDPTITSSTLSSTKNYKEVSINNKLYYQKLNENTWNGKYHAESFYASQEVTSIMEIVSYQKYLEYIDLINSLASDKIKPYYSNENCNYIILAFADGYEFCNMSLIDCFEENNKIIIYGDENNYTPTTTGTGYFIAIPTNMSIGTEIEYRECYTGSEINNLKKNNAFHNPTELQVDDKPIIYLYPTVETKVTVKLLKDKNLTCSYPKYQDGWNILAKPTGILNDLNNNRQLYSLYYENISDIHFHIENDGFVVKGDDSAKFLEEKLSILGLTERESEEFIIYWLPKLEANKYNYIRFASLDEINENMPLEITPNPDTIIRVLMTFKGLDTPIDVQEQQLHTPDRTGFVAVEWGGTEIK